MYNTSLSVAPAHGPTELPSPIKPKPLRNVQCWNSKIQPRLTVATTVCLAEPLSKSCCELTHRGEKLAITTLKEKREAPRLHTSVQRVDDSRLIRQEILQVSSVNTVKRAPEPLPERKLKREKRVVKNSFIEDRPRMKTAPPSNQNEAIPETPDKSSSSNTPLEVVKTQLRMPPPPLPEHERLRFFIPMPPLRPKPQSIFVNKTQIKQSAVEEIAKPTTPSPPHDPQATRIVQPPKVVFLLPKSQPLSPPQGDQALEIKKVEIVVEKQKAPSSPQNEQSPQPPPGPPVHEIITVESPIVQELEPKLRKSSTPESDSFEKSVITQRPNPPNPPEKSIFTIPTRQELKPSPAKPSEPIFNDQRFQTFVVSSFDRPSSHFINPKILYREGIYAPPFHHYHNHNAITVHSPEHEKPLVEIASLPPCEPRIEPLVIKSELWPTPVIVRARVMARHVVSSLDPDIELVKIPPRPRPERGLIPVEVIESDDTLDLIDEPVVAPPVQIREPDVAGAVVQRVGSAMSEPAEVTRVVGKPVRFHYHVCIAQSQVELGEISPKQMPALVTVKVRKVPQWESVVELDSVEQAEVMAGERELTPEPSELDLAEIEALPDADEVLVKIVGFAELELELKKALVETQDIQEAVEEDRERIRTPEKLVGEEANAEEKIRRRRDKSSRASTAPPRPAVVVEKEESLLSQKQSLLPIASSFNRPASSNFKFSPPETREPVNFAQRHRLYARTLPRPFRFRPPPLEPVVECMQRIVVPCRRVPLSPILSRSAGHLPSQSCPSCSDAASHAYCFSYYTHYY